MMFLSTLPRWLPSSMRYSADPLERLCSLVGATVAVATTDRTLFSVRIWKIRYLCDQLRPEAAFPRVSIGVTINDERVLLNMLDVAGRELAEACAGKRPIPAAIAGVQFCAMQLQDFWADTTR